MTDTSTESQPNGEAGQEKTGVATEGQQAQQKPQEESLDDILANYQPPKLDNRDSQQPQNLNQTDQGTQNDAVTLMQQTLTELRREVADLRQERAQDNQKAGLDAVLGDLVKDGGGDADDAFGFMAIQARHRPEINEIFERRHEDPATWRRTFAALKAKYSSRQKATEQKPNDNDAVREAAARRAPSDNSQRAKPLDLDPDGVGKMNEQEWRDYKRKKGIRDY